MSATPILYSQPGCQPCAQLKTQLQREQIAFEERDIRSNPAHLDELLATGFRSTPVTVIGDEAVVGADLQAIQTLLSGQRTG